MNQDCISALEERIRELEQQNEQLQKDFGTLKKKEQRAQEIGETFISISNRFLRAVDVDQAIHDSLADMGQLSGAGRAYLFLLSEDGKIMDNTHEWCVRGIKPEIDNLKNLPVASFPWWMKQLRKGENIHIKNVPNMFEEAKVEKELLESKGIKSLLVLPLYTGNQLRGFTGFDDVSKTGDWTQRHTKMLQAFSQIIVNALERRQYEKQLKEKSEFLGNITDNMFDLVSLTDLEGNYIFAGKSHEILGYDADSLIGDNVMDYVHPEDYPDVEKKFSEFLKSQDNRKVEYRYRCADNSYLWFETIGKLLKNENGNPKQLLFSTRDITKRKQAEMNLQKKEEELRAFNEKLQAANQNLEEHKDKLIHQNNLLEGVINGIPDILAIQYPDHTIERYNEAGYNILNMTPEEVRGKKCYKLIGRDHPCENCTTNKALKTKKLEQEEKYIPELGAYLDCRSNPILDKNGEVVRIVEQLRDITERKKAEQELIKAKEKAEES
ncbi:MAG: PAS domain S-box protein, partial [Bacteroidales bacterium]